MALFSTLFMMIQHWANFGKTEISNVLSPDKKVAIPDGDEKPRTCTDLPGIMLSAMQNAEWQEIQGDLKL